MARDDVDGSATRNLHRVNWHNGIVVHSKALEMRDYKFDPLKGCDWTKYGPGKPNQFRRKNDGGTRKNVGIRFGQEKEAYFYFLLFFFGLLGVRIHLLAW